MGTWGPAEAPLVKLETGRRPPLANGVLLYLIRCQDQLAHRVEEYDRRPSLLHFRPPERWVASDPCLKDHTTSGQSEVLGALLLVRPLGQECETRPGILLGDAPPGPDVARAERHAGRRRDRERAELAGRRRSGLPGSGDRAGPGSP
jgi:hypothetical protein